MDYYWEDQTIDYHMDEYTSYVWKTNHPEMHHDCVCVERRGGTSDLVRMKSTNCNEPNFYMCEQRGNFLEI